MTCVQLREKNLDEADFLAEAMEISALCRRYGVPFLINDNVDIALRCHADGVHVGQEDMQAAKVRQRLGPGRLIGVSAHSVEEAMAAEAAGADYLGECASADTGNPEGHLSGGGDSGGSHWRHSCPEYGAACRNGGGRSRAGQRYFWRGRH